MMDDAKNTYKVPTPQDSLESQIMDPNFPKNEREWWASEEITRLRAEVEALRADAERWRYINTRNNVWRRHITAGEEHSALCVILPYGADLSCRATREIAIDAARAAQGCEHAPSL